MNLLFSLVVSITLAGGPTAARAADIELVRNGVSRHSIVVATSTGPSEKHAAEVLQQYFKACTGVTLPIVAEPPAGDAPLIVLGCGPVAARLGVDPKPEELGEQGYVVRTVPPHVVIAGTRAAGTLYGVYDFLENALGVRWFAPGVTKTPTVKDSAVPPMDKLVRPAFLWRTTSYAWPGGDADFRAEQRDNAGGGGPDHPQGIQYAFDGQAHSYFSYINPSEFFDKHPEYFAEVGGVRLREETQLCLTNPEVLEIVAQRMLERMAKSPGVRQHNFSQMDWYNYCQCPRCTEINRKYGTSGGTQFWFVNQLAERTAKVYPDKLVGTLAYIYTEEPPKDLPMHPNVAVWLCHMFPSCDSHPIATCPLNADYKRRAEAWSKICKHLYVWHYIVDFAHYYNPFPNFHAMAADMKFYHEIGVEGIFLQGMGNGGGGGEFSLLRPYYGMKLLWNPDQDADAIIRDFLQGYYGAASEPIHQYIAMLHDKVESDNIHMHLYTNPAQGYLTDEIMQRAAGLFDQAEAAVKADAELLERVRVARMPLTFARLFPRNGYTIEPGKLVFSGDFAKMPETMDFLDRMQKHGFTTVREMMGEPKQMLLFCTMFNTPMPLATIQNEYLAVDIVPFLAGRALRIVDRKSGECVTAFNTTRNLMFPFAGGEETRIGGTYSTDIVANMVPFVLAEQTPASAVVETYAAAGLCIRRYLALEPDKPVLRIKTVVTNVSEKPREILLRSHLELDLGPLARTAVRFTNRGGEAMAREMKPIIAGLREGEHYYREKTPKSEWTFTGAKGLQVRQTFDDAQVESAWLYAYPDYLNDLEVELWAKPVKVEPKSTASLEHCIEIGPGK